MKIAGIIVEYNPLHNGHVHHFLETKRRTGADAVIAVMSGHFLQRGEPALLNKWARTEMALNMGADLILELPVAYSAQPAEWFAFGAVTALDRTGVVDCLCFGSESGELAWMQPLADLLSNEPAAFRRLLKQKLKSGINYPKAFSAAVIEMMADEQRLAINPEHLIMPNHTLGLHYLIALRRIQSRIIPYTIRRIAADYRQLAIDDPSIASATAIRKQIESSAQLDQIASYIPNYTLNIIKREQAAGRGPIQWEDYSRPLFHQLLSLPADKLAQILEVTEGLEHRLKQTFARLESDAHLTVQHYIDMLLTKRYTRTKIQRVLTRILLQHDKTDITPSMLAAGTPYLRVLGFSAAGKEILKRMKKTAKVPVIIKLSRDLPQNLSPMLLQDVQASSVYALAYRNVCKDELLRDYYQAPLQV